MFVCVVFPMKTLLQVYPRVSARQFYCWSNVLDVGLEFYRGCVNVPFFIKVTGTPLALVREWCLIRDGDSDKLFLS